MVTLSMEGVVSLPTPTEGDAPAATKISPTKPNPTTPPPDPASPRHGLQADGSFRPSKPQEKEIHRSEAKLSEPRPTIGAPRQKTGSADEALPDDSSADGPDKRILAELAEEIFSLLRGKHSMEQDLKASMGEQVRAEGSNVQRVPAMEGVMGEQARVKGSNVQRATATDGVMKSGAKSGRVHGYSPDLHSYKETGKGKEKLQDSPQSVEVSLQGALKMKHSNPRLQESKVKSTSTDLHSSQLAGKGKRQLLSSLSSAKVSFQWKTKHSSSTPSHPPWHQGSKVGSPSPDPQGSELEEGEIPDEHSKHQGQWTEVKKPHWWRQQKKASGSSARAKHPSERLLGSEKFKKLVYGRCFNCFAPDHHSKDCQLPPTCWRCNKSGHQSQTCPRAPKAGYIKHHREEKRLTTASHTKNTTAPPSTHTTPSRSYLQAALGTPPSAAMELAAFPGDPRARPVAESVFFSATGETERRRVALRSKAAVCRLEGSTHDSRPNHVGEALRSKLGMDWIDFQVIKHFPEQYLVIFREEHLQVIKHFPKQYLVIFREEHLCRQVVRLRSLEDEGRVFNFEHWSESRGAADAHLEFHVNIRIEGIPPHAWGEDLAAAILGRSASIHYVEDHTRRRESTRTYDLWAWSADPCRIPRKVWLTITDADEEQPSIHIPRNQVRIHHEEPSGLKHALGYEIFPHIVVVDDLSFSNGGDGGFGGPPNRRRRRIFEWRYGQPDGPHSRGNRDDRGRDEYRRQRRHDRDDDQGGRHRRHRSTSAWGRAVRCRSGVEDCYSSNLRGGRDYQGRGGGAYRSTAQQWVPKLAQLSSKIVPASAAATARRIMKEISMAVEDGKDNMSCISREIRTEGSMKELMDALPSTAKNPFHLDKPLQQVEMAAIQELLEHGPTQGKKKGRAMAPTSNGASA